MTKEEQQEKLFNDVKASCEKLGYKIQLLRIPYNKINEVDLLLTNFLIA